MQVATQHTTFDVTRRALESGATTVERVTGDYLAAIEKGKRLNAFLSVFNQTALQRAREVDRRRELRPGRVVGPGRLGSGRQPCPRVRLVHAAAVQCT